MARSLTVALVSFTLAACASSTPDTAAPSKVDAPIARADVENAQKAWCDALVAIGAEDARGGDAKALAERVLSTAYGYDRGPVLFKPTLTHGKQTFRMDKQGAIAYFVGGDSMYPDDKGFARKPWTTCRAEIANVVLGADSAMAMGNVYLTGADGSQVMVDKTFGYRKGPDGGLQIVLHHSSLPYTP